MGIWQIYNSYIFGSLVSRAGYSSQLLHVRHSISRGLIHDERSRKTSGHILISFITEHHAVTGLKTSREKETFIHTIQLIDRRIVIFPAVFWNIQ